MTQKTYECILKFSTDDTTTIKANKTTVTIETVNKELLRRVSNSALATVQTTLPPNPINQYNTLIKETKGSMVCTTDKNMDPRNKLMKNASTIIAKFPAIEDINVGKTGP